MATAMKKTSKGRQKIAIKPIKNQEARQVCFSKRRAGVFKKANELSILCDAEVAIIVFSPAGKPFSFGHPSVDSIVSRFLSGDPSRPRPPRRQAPPAEASVVPELDRRYRELAARLEEAKRRKEALEAEDLLRRRHRQQRGGSVADLLSASVEELGWPELDRLQRALEDLCLGAARRAKQLQLEAQIRADQMRGAAIAAHANAGAAGSFRGFFAVTATAVGNVVLPAPPRTGFGYGPPHGFDGFSN